jgi:ABC-type bacteriocin/lantibiotic exporter with double-glycine peptidase domain
MSKDNKTIALAIGIIGVLFFLAGILAVITLVTGILLAVICWIIAGFLSGCCKKEKKETSKKKK